MSQAVESVINALENKTEPASPVSTSSLTPLLGKVVSAAGTAYAFGFVVIMVHTGRLNAPVVEALQFQNIVAGLPIWALSWLGLWLWPRLMVRINAPVAEKGLSTWKMLLIFGVCAVALIFVLRWETSPFLSITGNNNLSAAFVVMSGGLFSFALYMWVELTRKKQEVRKVALFQLASYWSGLVFFVLVYAIFIYPLWPQSWGGGHPVQVRLLVKDLDIGSLLAGQKGENASRDSGPVLLYYRNGSYLLIGTPAQQHLIQVPADQVRSIVWLESQPR
jgi:hypothetical protein